MLIKPSQKRHVYAISVEMLGAGHKAVDDLRMPDGPMERAYLIEAAAHLLQTLLEEQGDDELAAEVVDGVMECYLKGERSRRDWWERLPDPMLSMVIPQ